MFELAERLHMTVGQLTSTMTAREFVEWAAYDTVVADIEERRQRKRASKAKKQRTKGVEADQ